MKRSFYAFWMCWGMFCGIPCPVRIWDEEARPRMISMLPLVGAVIGGVWVLLLLLCAWAGLPPLVCGAVLGAAPWLLSGCIHLDGYLDCCDAIFSRRELSKRQEILKDSHVGSFAVIGMVLLAMLTLALWAEGTAVSLWGLGAIPVASRACAALAVDHLRPMSSSQYAGAFAQKKRRSGDALPLLLLALSLLLPALLDGGVSALAPACTAVGYGAAVAYGSRQLGGFSGDVSGFALTLGELCGTAALTLCGRGVLL